MQQALYAELRNAMLEGRLQPGARLPSTRDLAIQLGIARGTVTLVYEQLRGEGYLASLRGSGTRVAETLPDRWFQEPQHSAGRAGEGRHRGPRLSAWGKGLRQSPFGDNSRPIARPFRAHIPAVDAFPTEIWSRLLVHRARTDERLLLGDGDVRGYAPLREALAAHLRVARGVSCTADEVIIMPSVQRVLDIAARLTLAAGDAVWMEDPGYSGALFVFRAVGARIVPVPVDADGMNVMRGRELCPDARLAYITPGRQAPLGPTLSMERRLALLTHAEARRMLVIEDDYDSEYRYQGRPIPALAALDRAGLVLHTGTFSKTLLPSLRLSYAVVREPLLGRFVSAASGLDRFTPPLQQAALADFITEGHFGRHLRKMRELYAERRTALIGELARVLPEAEVMGASAGLDLAVRLPSWVND